MSRLNSSLLALATMMSLIFAASCSDSEDGAEEIKDNPNGKTPGVWTLHTSLEALPAAEGDVHLAFVWRSPVKPLVATDVAIESDSPLTVDLDIYEIPNTDILTSSDDTVPPQLFKWEYSRMVDANLEPVEHPTVRWSQGKLVLYEDVNDNGELDLLPSGATDAIDRILGGAFGYDFYYIESGDAHPFVNVPEVTNGLNMVSLSEDRYERKPISLETEIAITLDDSDDVQRIMCPYFRDKQWEDGRHTANKRCNVVSADALSTYFPSGAIPEIEGHCVANGLIFEWYDTELSDDAVCSTEYIHGDYNIIRLTGGEEAPADWPCEFEDDEFTGYPAVILDTLPDDEVGMFQSDDLDACYDLLPDLIERFNSEI